MGATPPSYTSPPSRGLCMTLCSVMQSVCQQCSRWLSQVLHPAHPVLADGALPRITGWLGDSQICPYPYTTGLILERLSLRSGIHVEPSVYTHHDGARLTDIVYRMINNGVSNAICEDVLLGYTVRVKKGSVCVTHTHATSMKTSVVCSVSGRSCYIRCCLTHYSTHQAKPKLREHVVDNECLARISLRWADVNQGNTKQIACYQRCALSFHISCSWPSNTYYGARLLSLRSA